MLTVGANSATWKGEAVGISGGAVDRAKAVGGPSF